MTNMDAWFIVGGILLVLVVVGAFLHDRSARVNAGKIVGKRFKLAHQATEFRQVGKAYIPFLVYRPDAWFVTLEGKRRSGKVGRYEWEVGKNTYNALQIGQQWRARPWP